MSSAPVNRLKRLAAIVEFSEDAIYGMDMDGIISDWNNGAEQLYGYTADEVIGKPISLLIPPDHSDEFPTIMQKMRRGESVAHYETVRQKKDGTRVDVDLSASPIRDETGRIIGAAAIARDISDRNKRYKGALRESEEALEEGARQLHSQEELLKIFVKNVPAGVAMFDREMRYLQVSDRWCADYSIDSSQMLGRSHYDIVPDMPE